MKQLNYDSENLGRITGEYTAEPGEKVQRGPGEIEGRAFEGQTTEQQLEGVTYNEISADAWSDEMTALAKDTDKKYGVKTVYFSGVATNSFGDAASGFYFDGTLYLQADSETESIEQLRNHEITHNFENTKVYDDFRKSLKQKLSETEYRILFNNIRKNYQSVVDEMLKKAHSENESISNEELVKRITDYIDGEILANINAGTTEYADRFADEVAAFRKGIENSRAEDSNDAKTDTTSRGENKPSEYKAETDAGPKFKLAGTWPDGRKVYKTNYPKNTPKSVKQNDIINLIQQVWSQKPINLRMGEGIVTAYFDPTLSERSDLSKIAFGNRKGNASDKRITLDLSSDLYMIAQDSLYRGSKSETGKRGNPAHNDVKEWKYFATDLIYEDDTGNLIPCYMNIDVKVRDDGNYFYSFGIEKGTAPQTLLAVVNEDNSSTVPNNRVPQNDTTVNSNSMQNDENNSQIGAEKSEEVRFSLADKNKDDLNSVDSNIIFNADESVKENLSSQIDKWLKGEMKSNESFEFGDTPFVLQTLGANKLPVIMSQDTMAKITGVKHPVSLENVRKLADGINDPLMVFKSATIDNAFVLLTELEDMEGRPIIAAIHLNKVDNRMKINRMASVYGRNGANKFVTEQFRIGNVKYIDKIKSQEWSTSRGLQLPKLVQSNPDNNNILQKEDIVNRYYMTNSKKYADDDVRFNLVGKDKNNSDVDENLGEGYNDTQEEVINNEIQRSNRRRTDGVSEKSRDTARGNRSDKSDISVREKKSRRDGMDNNKYGRRNVGKRSSNESVEFDSKRTSATGFFTMPEDTRKGQRYVEAINSDDRVSARQLLDEEAEKKGFKLVNLYHGTKADKAFYEFNDERSIWVTTDKKYADRYAIMNEEKSYLFTSDDSYVYELYANFGKILDLGEINKKIKTFDDLSAFAERIGFSEDEITKSRIFAEQNKISGIWGMSYSKEFADIARKKGYHTLKATEDGTTTYGILYPERVKSSKLVTYDNNGNIIPLEKRFDLSKKDIRFNFVRDEKKNSESGETDGYEQNSAGKKLGWNEDSSETERLDRMGEVGYVQSKKSNTPHTKRVHRSGVSAETITSSSLTAEQAALKEQNQVDKLNTEFYVKATENGIEQSDLFVTENTIYYPDSAFERDDISVKNGVASFTEKRFNDLIEEYSVPVGGQLNRDYAKAYVAYISPSEFLRLTAVNEELIVLDTARYGSLDVETLKNNDVRQGPYLEIDFKNGRVYEHNGRHRMVMLRDAGINKVAIVVRDISSEQNKYKTTKYTDIVLLRQKFNNGESAPGKVKIDEIIPLSPNYRSEARNKFVDVKSDIRYNLSGSALDTQKFIEKRALAINDEELIEAAKLWTQKEAVLKMHGTGIVGGDIKNCLNNHNVKSERLEDYWVSVCE